MKSAAMIHRYRRIRTLAFITLLALTTRALAQQPCGDEIPPPSNGSLLCQQAESGNALATTDHTVTSERAVTGERTATKENAASSSRDAERDVRAVFADYFAAFNVQDTAQLASHWKTDGVFADRESGQRTVGRDAIERHLQSLFDRRSDLSLAGRLHSIRFVRPDVAHVSGYAVSVGDDDEPLESGFTAIVVREGEKWLLDIVDENLLPPAAEPHQRLAPLEFLIGRWEDVNAEESVVTTTRWGSNRSFLVRSYTVQPGQENPAQGTQVIGWDPNQQRIRCWMFNSDGSFGEGVWSEIENGWAVKITQTLADGSIAAATQSITIVDQDTLLIQLVGEEIEGRLRPPSKPVRVVRVTDLEDLASE